jgi:hypothetical protein
MTVAALKSALADKIETDGEVSLIVEADNFCLIDPEWPIDREVSRGRTLRALIVDPSEPLTGDEAAAILAGGGACSGCAAATPRSSPGPALPNRDRRDAALQAHDGVRAHTDA